MAALDISDDESIIFCPPDNRFIENSPNPLENNVIRKRYRREYESLHDNINFNLPQARTRSGSRHWNISGKIVWL